MAPKSVPGELRVRLPAIAVLTASFLSGAMVSISAITVPVLLDTNTHPTLLLHQWSRLYHYGHIIMPSLAVATTGLFAYLALRRRHSAAPTAGPRSAKGRKQNPLMYAAAAAATIAIVPFTFLAMTSTNETLFGLEKLASLTVEEAAEAAVDLSPVRGMIVKWAWLHVARSMLPLAGAVLGFRGLLQEFGQQ